MTGKVKLRPRDYAAVSVMVEIARKSGQTPAASSRVAEAIGASSSHLEQLTADLRGGGLIKSFRGKRGGYVLAKPADRISVLDIVLSAEDRASGRYKETDDRLVSSRNPHSRDLQDQLEKFQYFLLQHISLADVVSGSLSNHAVVERVLNMLAGGNDKRRMGHTTG